MTRSDCVFPQPGPAVDLGQIDGARAANARKSRLVAAGTIMVLSKRPGFTVRVTTSLPPGPCLTPNDPMVALEAFWMTPLRAPEPAIPVLEICPNQEGTH
jgi:hypothetical protein